LLRTRLILGTIFVAVLVGLCWLDYHAARPGVYLLPLAAVLSILSASELLGLFGRRKLEPLAWGVYVGTLLTVLGAGTEVLFPSFTAQSTREWWSWGQIVIAMAMGCLFVLAGELYRHDPGKATNKFALCCFAILYAGGLMSLVVRLRLLSGERWGDNGHWGMLVLLSLVATVKMSDIGQYTIGKLFGRQKLAPVISPGKTWEGAAGGIAFAVVAAVLVFVLGPRYIVGGAHDTLGFVSSSGGLIAIVLFAVLVAAAGILGDLAESVLKRDAGVKDSSDWLPGFGGVLDLLDSLLGAAPVAYVFWVLGIVGP
jgi:phosphatidate cytidylyltransferase